MHGYQISFFEVTVVVEFPLADVIIQCKVNQIPIYFLCFVLTVFVGFPFADFKIKCRVNQICIYFLF